MLESSHMNDTNCIFCKIIADQIPSVQIYEDADTLAFLDINPVNPGHTLVIPKTHYVNVFDAPEEMWTRVMATAKKIAHALEKGLPTGDVNITTNNGAHSGQMVFHSHVHVIPRYEGDGFGLWHGTPYKDGEAHEIAEKIKIAL